MPNLIDFESVVSILSGNLVTQPIDLYNQHLSLCSKAFRLILPCFFHLSQLLNEFTVRLFQLLYFISSLR